MEFDDLKDWAEKLKDLSQTYPVLVEGKRDRDALLRLGISNVITLGGKRIADLPDILEGSWRGAILLYDLDKQGDRIEEKVKRVLRDQGFHVIEVFREYLREVGIIHIEELSSPWKG